MSDKVKFEYTLDDYYNDIINAIKGEPEKKPGLKRPAALQSILNKAGSLVNMKGR